MYFKKKVCVIGAGLTGLGSMKCLLDSQFHVKCFEKDSNIGGRWHADNNNPIPRSTILNTPNFLSCFSDFPMSEEHALFVTADSYISYIQDYAEQFELRKHIYLNHEVINVKVVSTDNTVCGWSVTYKVGDIIAEEEFDFLMITSGFYSLPYIPENLQKTIKDFTGRVSHSVEYKDWKGREDKTVVVIGLGNTGADIASEIADHCKKAFISTNRCAYVIPRISQGGKLTISRLINRAIGWVPSFLIPTLALKGAQRFANSKHNAMTLGLVPRDGSSTTVINDKIGDKMITGKLKLKPGIKSVNNKTVIFTDGTIIDEVDEIILCTGYKRNFTFFEDKNILERDDKYIPLYKNIFLSKYGDRLAFINMQFNKGPFAIMSEMQSRYAIGVFQKSIKFPPTAVMEYDIEKQRQSFDADKKEYNFIPFSWLYYDKLATEIGCKPSLLRMMLTDLLLAWQLVWQYSPHEFRLVGPNSWGGARQQILKTKQSMFSFLNH